MSLLKEDVSKYTNAGISKFAVAIASLTATKADAVQKFADTNELNIEKLYQFLKRSKLDGKMDFVTALVGKPGNPIQKKMIKMFSESVNEEEIKWNAVENAIINFLKMNTKILDKRVQAKDTDGVKSGLKSIINGLTNAQRSLKLESVNEENELPKATVPASVKAKLDMAIDKIKDTKLSYNQKLNIVVSVMDSLGIDKSQFGKMASKLKGSMEEISVNEAKVFVHNEKTGEKYEVLSGKGKGDLLIAMKALEKSAPSHMKYSIKESVNEADVVNRQLNVKVNKMLERELGDLRKGGPNHQFAIMYILQGALTDANFHSDAKKVPSLFPKAKYEGDPMAEKDLIQMYEYDLGPNIAALAKWDGKDIVNAIGFYVSMTVGRPMGEKIEKLVESKK